MPSRPCAAQGYGFILAYERCLLEGPCRSLRRCRSGHRTSELRDGKTQQEFRELAACCDSGVGFRDGTSCVHLRFCRALLALGSEPARCPKSHSEGTPTPTPAHPRHAIASARVWHMHARALYPDAEPSWLTAMGIAHKRRVYGEADKTGPCRR